MSYYDALTSNGTEYSGEALVKFSNDKLLTGELKDYEKSLYSFILEWISSSDVIEAKTSGTTGQPKVVLFKKLQAVASAQMTCDYFKLNKNTNALLSLSTEFIGGKMMVVRAFVCGMNLITIEPSGNPLEEINQRIDFASMVPLQVQNSLLNEETKRKFLAISNVIIGGASLSPTLEKKVAECTNNVYSTFAMTETLSHIALKKLSGTDKKDYYETLPGIAISTDGRNCLVINTPLLNEKIIITNDVVKIISPARFRWLGRYDNVINSGGIKIHPEIIENKLAAIIPQHKYFITSLPDEMLGRKVVMVIECSGDFDVNSLKKGIGNILPKYEIPKAYLRIEKFIETASGKVKKEDTLKSAKKF